MRFDVYEDMNGEFRWTLYAVNGEPLAVASEGYKRVEDCENAIGVVMNQSITAEIVRID